MYSRVYVEITNVCNKSCSFCHGHGRAPRRMSEEEFREVIKALSGVTRYLYYHVMGEPLTHPLLPRFIGIANEAGFKSAVTTNGTLLSKMGQSLIDAGVYKVNISVHSFEDGGEERYREYLTDCFDFADRASKAGVLTVLRLWNNGFDEGRNADILRRLREKFPEDEWVEGKRGFRIRHKLHLEYGERFDWPDINAADGGDDVFCYGLCDHFAVLCDGSVVPCCLDSDGVMSLGNILENSVEDILTGQRAVNIKSGFERHRATEELCRKCGYARRFK